MKNVSVALAAHLAGDVTTLCTCWKVTRQSGIVNGFTDHDQDVVFGGVTYQASGGFTASNVQTTAALQVDNMEVTGFLSSPSITEGDLHAGLWDHASVLVFLLNWADMTMGALNVRYGYLGEVTAHRSNFVAELRGLTQNLSRTLGEVYTPACRADLGDARCKVVLAPYTASGTVTSVTDNQTFATSLGSSTVQLTASPVTTGTPPDGYFVDGKLTWLAGPNSGASVEVRSYTAVGGQIITKLQAGYNVSVGDAFSVYRGCNKIGRAGDCKLVFNNYVNFRGEEDLPGLDKILQVGGR